MSKKVYGLLVVLLVLLVSCSMHERIVFNEDMGGRYESKFDLSQIMAIAAQSGASNPEKKKEKMDTTMVFNDFLEIYKDSIATLPAAQQENVKALKDFAMNMNIDEENGVMVLTVIKDFKEFKEIERIAYDVDKVFESAKKTTPGGEQATSSPTSSMLNTNKVIYTFIDNTFRRTDPKALSRHLEGSSELSEKTRQDVEDAVFKDENGEVENNMMKDMVLGMDEVLDQSTMQLEYVFPRKVISVSQEGAIISEDGKTVTFSIDYKTLLEGTDKTLENFEVVLEDK
ncbi:hypothetical protein [Dokdonia sp. PRO95]|uniref:hypothetical protein n=1 Tax=Dokdonia sp. PRO95 TaxID=1239415 RepID=UPI0005531461|nr:hypothetical protein [Dokdonia sp. PRO95]